MKRPLVLFLLAVLAFPASTATLKMSWWGGDSRHQGTIAAIELWNKNHPAAKVEYWYSGWDGYHDKLTVQLAGGTAPDVFQYSYSSTSQYGDMDVLEDLTPYIKTKFGDFAEGMWRYGSYKGMKLGAPTGAATYAMMFNKTMLQKLGVRLPTMNETWESYLELCKAATRDTNGDGKIDFWGAANLYEIPVDGLIPIYNQFGIQVWTADGKHSMFDNATAQSIWKMFKTFVDAKVCLGPLDATVPEGLTPLSAGLVATSFGPSSGFSSQVAAAEGKYELDMVRLPQRVKGKSGQTVDTPMLFAIYKKGKNKPQAVDFLSWFLTDVEAAKATGMIRGMYGTTKLREALKGTFKGYDLIMAKLLDTVEAEKNPPPMAEPPMRDQWEDIMNSERDKLVHGQVTLEEFFKNVIKYADPSLSE